MHGPNLPKQPVVKYKIFNLYITAVTNIQGNLIKLPKKDVANNTEIT